MLGIWLFNSWALLSVLSWIMGCGGWFFACAGFFLPIALNTAATTTRRAAPRYTTNFRLPWRTPRGSPWLCLSAAGPAELFVEIVLGHGHYPFVERVNSIRFLPNSTYPLLMILGMM